MFPCFFFLSFWYTPTRPCLPSTNHFDFAMAYPKHIIYIAIRKQSQSNLFLLRCNLRFERTPTHNVFLSWFYSGILNSFFYTRSATEIIIHAILRIPSLFRIPSWIFTSGCLCACVNFSIYFWDSVYVCCLFDFTEKYWSI